MIGGVGDVGGDCCSCSCSCNCSSNGSGSGSDILVVEVYLKELSYYY